MPDSSIAAAVRSRLSTTPDEKGRPAVGGGAGRRGEEDEAVAGVADVDVDAAGAPAGGKLTEGRRSLADGVAGKAVVGAVPIIDGRRSSEMRACGSGLERVGTGEPASV
jgi:hypothetical protein